MRITTSSAVGFGAAALQTPVVQDLAYQRAPWVTLADVYGGGGISTVVAAGPGTAMLRTAAQQAGAATVNNAVGPAMSLPASGPAIVLGLGLLILLGYVYHHPRGIL